MGKAEERHSLVLDWLKECRLIIEEELESDLKVETKSNHRDLVTHLDKKIERILVDHIQANFPRDLIIGEEGYGDEVSTTDGTLWIIDPIDGTMNFVLQQENYAIMLAIFEDGVGIQSYIYDVAGEKLYYALKDHGVFCNGEALPKIKDIPLKEGLYACSSYYHSFPAPEDRFTQEMVQEAMGLRMYGSAGIEAIEIVKGNTVAYVAHQAKPWDFTPGLIMVREAGGVVSTFNGGSINILENTSVIMGTPKAHNRVMKKIQQFRAH